MVVVPLIHLRIRTPRGCAIVIEGAILGNGGIIGSVKEIVTGM